MVLFVSDDWWTVTESCLQFLRKTEPHRRLESLSLPALPMYDCAAEVTPSEWYSGLEDLVPEAVLGSDFLAQFGKHYDKVTEVQPDFTCVRCLSDRAAANISLFFLAKQTLSRI